MELTQVFGFYGDTSVVTPIYTHFRQVESEEAEKHYHNGGSLLINPFGMFTSNRLPNATQYVDGWVYIGDVEQVDYIIDYKIHERKGIFERGKYATSSGAAYMHWDGDDPDFHTMASWYIPVEGSE